MGIKAAGAYGWQPYHLHVPFVLKSGSLNLLEPSGPVQACNGTALPLPIRVFMLSVSTVTCSPVYQSVRISIATFVYTQLQVWSVHFSVPQMPAYKYVLHAHDNRFSTYLGTFIVFNFPSVRVLSPSLLFIYSSVRTFASSGAIDKFCCSSYRSDSPPTCPNQWELLLFLIRKFSVLNLGPKTGHQRPLFPEISCC
jgi:hypothetical protein